MNAATLDSPRLASVLALLTDRGEEGATTREIARKTGVCAVSAIVSELRARKVKVRCRYERTTARGARVYRYRIGGAA